MRTYTILLGVCLILISSCKKTSTIITGDAGSWVTSNATASRAVACVGNVSSSEATLTAYTAYPETSTSSKMIITFYKKLPTTSGTYFIAGLNTTLTDTTQMKVQLITSTDTYSSGGSAHINIIVSNGKVKVIGSGINLYNSNFNTVGISININQLQ